MAGEPPFTQDRQGVPPGSGCPGGGSQHLMSPGTRAGSLPPASASPGAQLLGPFPRVLYLEPGLLPEPGWGSWEGWARSPFLHRL